VPTTTPNYRGPVAPEDAKAFAVVDFLLNHGARGDDWRARRRCWYWSLRQRMVQSMQFHDQPADQLMYFATVGDAKAANQVKPSVIASELERVHKLVHGDRALLAIIDGSGVADAGSVVDAGVVAPKPRPAIVDGPVVVDAGSVVDAGVAAAPKSRASSCGATSTSALAVVALFAFVLRLRSRSSRW
jgi:hypothetical protein